MRLMEIAQELSNFRRTTINRDRRAAAGKSLLVYLFSGSLGLAIVAFIFFKLIGW